MNFTEMFHAFHPDFFEQEHIRRLPPEDICDELALDLHTWQADVPVPCPAHIAFGLYKGAPEALHAAVSLVEPDWVRWFGRTDRVFCGYDGDRVVSFCLLDDFGKYAGLRVGGPGCVGTIPVYRKQGIGLRMVQLATEKLKAEGYDLSWIHYTHIGYWYAGLGYQTVVRWNCRGIVE